MKKEFNIEDYLTGKYDVVTRNGKPVQILKTNVCSIYPIVGIVPTGIDSESVCTWTCNGSLGEGDGNNYDLFLVDKAQKLYLVHFLDNHLGYQSVPCKDISLKYCVRVFSEKETAEHFVRHCAEYNCKAIRIEEVEVEGELLKE